MMVCLTVPQLLRGSSIQERSYLAFSSSYPGVSVGIEEDDMMHCKFITLLALRDLGLVLTLPVPLTHSGNCALSTTNLRIE